METKIIILLAILIIAVVIERVIATSKRKTIDNLENSAINDFMDKYEKKCEKIEKESKDRLDALKKQNNEIRFKSLKNEIQISSLRGSKPKDQIEAEIALQKQIENGELQF